MFRRFILISVIVCTSGEIFPLLQGRIVGGRATTINKFPHEISIEYNEEHICGGSIISETVIVTAAHCMYGRSTAGGKIHAGSTRKSGDGVRIALEQIIVHEHYDSYYQDNDIALLALANRLQFSNTIKAIPLAESSRTDKVGSVAQVSGWGLLNEYGVPPDTLRYVEVHIIDSKICATHYKMMGFRIHESMICAGAAAGGKDACMEDSGSPLISGGVLIGIVSWGIGCGQKDFPGVYSRISYLRNWIDRNRPDM